MVGGKLVAIQFKTLKDEDDPNYKKEVYQLTVRDTHHINDYCHVYTEPYDLRTTGPKFGEVIWWQSGKIFYNNDVDFLPKIGYSFSQ